MIDSGSPDGNASSRNIANGACLSTFPTLQGHGCVLWAGHRWLAQHPFGKGGHGRWARGGVSEPMIAHLYISRAWNVDTLVLRQAYLRRRRDFILRVSTFAKRCANLIGDSWRISNALSCITHTTLRLSSDAPHLQPFLLHGFLLALLLLIPQCAARSIPSLDALLAQVLQPVLFLSSHHTIFVLILISPSCGLIIHHSSLSLYQ